MSDNGEKLSILMVSVHGLIRSRDLELGRDADTGGQVKYVVELGRALARDDRVDRVELVTRQIHDDSVDALYGKNVERITPGASIVRIPCGPKRYLKKEALWPYLDQMSDNIVKYIRSSRRPPDVIHGHYADGGYVAASVAGLLDVPMVFTGHSLGQDKKRRLLDQGVREETIEKRYRISQRIEAEEMALDHAAFVIASTREEIKEQYKLYDNYHPRRMIVIPPGTDTGRFFPYTKRYQPRAASILECRRFLGNPDKPVILALSRPDPKKNLPGIIKAFGENANLRKIANLVLVAGSRTDYREMDRPARGVIEEILRLVDYYDLYGSVAYPKDHRADEVPELYRWAAATRGIFVNAAVVEPFGLTLIEAGACGLPVVATNDGGPREIVRKCGNGLLVDPLDVKRLGKAMESALQDRERWKKWSANGINGVQENYSWKSHASKYTEAIQRITMKREGKGTARKRMRKRFVTMDRLLISDIDNTLIGDKKGLRKLLGMLEEAGPHVGFGIATGRRLESAVNVLKEWHVPLPSVLITAVGSELHFGVNLIKDGGWTRHISYRWNAKAVRAALKKVPGLKSQPAENQRTHKVSYFVDSRKAPPEKEIASLLRKKDIHVRTIFSHGKFLDILPIRASKGRAIRYFAMKWDIPIENVVVAGDSGNDVEMLKGNTLGIVVGNYSDEVEWLRGEPGVYFAESDYARGIIEGLSFYHFL